MCAREESHGAADHGRAGPLLEEEIMEVVKDHTTHGRANRGRSQSAVSGRNLGADASKLRGGANQGHGRSAALGRHGGGDDSHSARALFYRAHCMLISSRKS